MRDVRNLFELPIDEDYYKLIIPNSASNNNHSECESKGDKDQQFIN